MADILSEGQTFQVLIKCFFLQHGSDQGLEKVWEQRTEGETLPT